MTKYVGLIGYPLGHSISPPMQQAAFDHLGLDVRYQLWETEQGDLSAAVEGIRQSSRLGSNVTIPYKEMVIPLVDELDDFAREIGAVNTLVNRDGRLVGYNTDAGGFVQALRREGGFDSAGKRVVQLGAGGVARAVSFALARAGAKSFVITDIVAERARDLASDLEQSRSSGADTGLEVTVLFQDDPKFVEALLNCDLLINCTPIGMKHSASEGESPLDEKLIPKGIMVYDVVYNPLETPLLAAAKRAGANTLGGLSMLERTNRVLETRGPRRVSPFYIPMIIGNMAPGMISIQFGAKGPNSSVATACAAGAHAIGDAANIIKRGAADAMIAGGVESVITPTCIAGFNAMKALSTRNEDPQKASRPFDRDRDGFVVGEGSGILILETLEGALARGASIYAEIIGYGMSGDGYHMTSPSPDGEGAARCMSAALKDAGIAAGAVDYINAHGTSTQLNDLFETRAVKTVFGEKVGSLMISSTKSMTGHLLGGAGGIETVFTALTIHRGMVPPTINLENPAEECDLDYVPGVARKADVQVAMTNSFGFGGTNASLILKKYTH